MKKAIAGPACTRHPGFFVCYGWAAPAAVIGANEAGSEGLRGQNQSASGFNNKNVNLH